MGKSFKVYASKLSDREALIEQREGEFAPLEPTILEEMGDTAWEIAVDGHYSTYSDEGMVDRLGSQIGTLTAAGFQKSEEGMRIYENDDGTQWLEVKEGEYAPFASGFAEYMDKTTYEAAQRGMFGTCTPDSPGVGIGPLGLFIGTLGPNGFTPVEEAA